MFRIEIDTIEPAVMRAFANMFNELASTGGIVMTGDVSRISVDDSPETGTDVITQATTTAAAVFGAQPASQDAAAVFGAQPAQFDASNAPNAAGGATGSQEASSQTADTSASTPAAAPPAPPASAATAGVLLDAQGLPWDVRIHAGTRTRTQKGIWKQKKGVDDATIAAVEAELRATLAIPAAEAKPFVPLNAPPPPPPAAAAAPAPAATPPAPPAPGAAPTTFAELCRYITGRGFPAPKILEVVNKHGLAGLGLVAVRPDLIPAIYADFAAA